MAEPMWLAAKRVVVPAIAKYGFWTLALDYVEASKWLKFVVDDVPGPVPAGGGAAAPTSPRWTYAPQRKCTADGDPAGPLNPVTCLMTTAAAGALIGKVGGSCAGRAEDGRVFVIGSLCQVQLDDKTRGPLYLAMNIDPARPLDRDESITVSVFVSG